MTSLRKRMIRELQLHRKPPHTIGAYVTAVAQLAKHYGRSPDKISVEEIRDFLHHLIVTKKLAYSSVNQKLAGIRFFWHGVLRREKLDLRVLAKRSGRLPEAFGRNEIARLIDAAICAKHRVLIMTCYATGLQVSELVHLRVEDIQSQRMLLHVRQGKAQGPLYAALRAAFGRTPRMLAGNSAATVAVSQSHSDGIDAQGDRAEGILRDEEAYRHPPRPGHSLPGPQFRHSSARSRR